MKNNTMREVLFSDKKITYVGAGTEDISEKTDHYLWKMMNEKGEISIDVWDVQELFKNDNYIYAGFSTCNKESEITVCLKELIERMCNVTANNKISDQIIMFVGEIRLFAIQEAVEAAVYMNGIAETNTLFCNVKRTDEDSEAKIEIMVLAGE